MTVYDELLADVSSLLDEFGSDYEVFPAATYDQASMVSSDQVGSFLVRGVLTSTQRRLKSGENVLVSELYLSPTVDLDKTAKVLVNGVRYALTNIKEIQGDQTRMLYQLELSE